jgi:hypothetical protein
MPADHMSVRLQPAAVQRVVIRMPITRRFRNTWGKLLHARNAARAAAADKAAARDIAQQQMPMQQLAERLRAGSGKAPSLAAANWHRAARSDAAITPPDAPRPPGREAPGWLRCWQETNAPSR